MKGKLEFDLPEDDKSFKLAQNGINFYCTLLSIKRIIREYEKYKHLDTIKVYQELIEEIKAEIMEVNLDDY